MATIIRRDELTQVRRFGVELEMVNVPKQMLIDALKLQGIDCVYEGYTHSVTNHWKLVTDSTIRNHNPNRCGMELVSPILEGEAGMAELERVCKALVFCGCDVNRSCGVHVHHDTSHLNLTDQNKTNLMNFYARLERTIDAFMPKSRKRANNNYCNSMVQAYWDCQSYNNLEDLGRYYKLNFSSNYGTLEFRQHNGTTEFDKLYNWIIFTANFMNHCKDKRSTTGMNYIERAWTPKHLKLSKKVWSFFKERMKKLDDLPRDTQNVRADRASLRVGTLMRG